MPRVKPVILVLLALARVDAAQLTTNYKRVGKRVEFGGSWLIRETFDDGVDAARRGLASGPAARQPGAGGAAALVGSQYSMSADLIGPLVFVPDRALRLAAAGVNRKLALGDRFADGVSGVAPAAPSCDATGSTRRG
ncbi:hypothetical protein JL721_3605 [Aureococcus anophagefferens]|nr:hypothetical protein JL721_3605 [Aureococcus anophagefferens]